MQLEKKLLDTYSALLEPLSDDTKLELIERLSKSVRHKNKKPMSVDDLYGAWKDDRSAEDIIAQLRAARIEKRIPPII